MMMWIPDWSKNLCKKLHHHHRERRPLKYVEVLEDSEHDAANSDHGKDFTLKGGTGTS